MQIEIVPKYYFQSINQFKFISNIGLGSFGKVKLAVHRGTHKKYAIKIIDLKSNLSSTQIQLISRQIKVHSKLDHPHIIKLWDTLIEDQQIYMIMDYAQNGSLFSYHSAILKEGKQPSLQQIYKFFYQTLQAVKYLHRNDIMHRDIKPENLLLDQNLNIRVCDFGWATNQIHSPRTTFCGTYQYMAPEMALQKSYDCRIDIWALGVLLYELVHGIAPFQAQSLKVMKQKINKGSYQINSNCSSQLKDLIVDILQFIPDKRLNLVAIQNHPWVKQHHILLLGGKQEQDNVKKVNHTCNLKKQKTKQNHDSLNKLRKNRNQKSMGNFILESYKNKFDDSVDDQNNLSKIKQNQICQQSFHSPIPVTNKKQDKTKKHKRNITQPINNANYQQFYDFQQKKDNQKSNIHKKMEILLGSIKTQADTPLHNNQYAKLNFWKSKKKCKTQGEDELTMFSTNFNLMNRSKKDLFQYLQKQQEQQTNKKKSYLRTQAGATISTNLPNHNRNCSASQLKQNDKMKKKVKANPHMNDYLNHHKIKKAQQKHIHQFNGKYASNEKLKIIKNLYNQLNM